MRNCLIKINNDATVNVSEAHDYVGEHRATQLSISLNSDLTNSAITYYTLCFKPGAALKNPPQCKLTSDMIPAQNLDQSTLTYRLPAALTCFGSLDCQVIAHCISDKDEVTEIIKSPVFRIFFEPSISGEDELFVEQAQGFTALIHTALAQLNLTIDEAEELFNKINEAYENGELNGAVIMPHVSEDGTLSWSNDAGFENPPPVNIKGPKGDKGDKGDKGEDGKFSDELADEITANTAARHTHPNKELLDSLTESMIGTLDVYHELPQTANDGDICIYSPANVPSVDDSGKLIYVDWDVFNKTFAQEDFTQFTITFFDSDGTEAGYIYATSWEGSNGGYDTTFEYTKGNEQWSVSFIDGVFDSNNSRYFDGTNDTVLYKAPTSFTLPNFSRLESDHYNIGGDVFYAPIKLMVYRDGWYEYTSAAVVDVSIGHGYELPESAKEGDLFLYANSNTLTDRGKRIYFDWNEFSKPVSEEDAAAFSVWCGGNADGLNTLEGNGDRNPYECRIWLQRLTADGTLESLAVVFENGIFNSELSGIEITPPSSETQTTYFNSVDELPLYFELPEFEDIEHLTFSGNAYFFHTEYELMKYQGGEWIAAFETDIATNRIKPTETALTIQPNTDYSFGESETLTITLANGKESKRNEYMFSFISGATPTVLTLPDTVKWVNELTIEANKRYEISIVDNIGLWCAVEVSE